MKDTLIMYISSWAEHGGAPGLGMYQFHLEDGSISKIAMINRNESFNGMCVSQEKHKLYVNNETWHMKGESCLSGSIFTYDIEKESGRCINEKKYITGCPCPTYVEVDPTGKYLIEAHHSYDLEIAKYVRNETGKLEKNITKVESAIQVYQLDEENNPCRLVESFDQRSLVSSGKCHPHSAVISPSGNLIAVTDKGAGELFLYHFDDSMERLQYRSRIMTDRKGASARCVVFHPDKKIMFVNHEASYDGKCYISVIEYQEDGQMMLKGIYNVLNEQTAVNQYVRLEQQGLCINQRGNILYSLINAADCIAVVRVNEDCSLQPIANVPIPGKWPRGLALTPDGKYLVVTCLLSGNICVYQVCEDGNLKLINADCVQEGASNVAFYKTE